MEPNPRPEFIHGYFTSIRKAGKLSFVTLVDPQLRKSLQLVIDPVRVGDTAWKEISQLRPHTPVAVRGHMMKRDPAPIKILEPTQGLNLSYHFSDTSHSSGLHPDVKGSSDKSLSYRIDPYVGRLDMVSYVEMMVHKVITLNRLPQNIAKADTNFPPEQRHLQLRTNSGLRYALHLRSSVQNRCRTLLLNDGFDEIETPILSKSTPEGAREFLVPTRHSGRAYALAQSPQQFKQILMASGISKYFQFAKCFRDEDMRADRQPEFTQVWKVYRAGEIIANIEKLDMEMSFAGSEDIMRITERLVHALGLDVWGPHAPDPDSRFDQISYSQAMSSWGSDKPDRRLGGQIFKIQNLLDPLLISKITPLETPIIEMMRLKVKMNPSETKKFITSFFDSPSTAKFSRNPDGAPGIAIFDPSMPMDGLAIFEHEAKEAIEARFHPQRGDVLVFQARPNRQFQGESSTMLGDLRRDLYSSLIAEGMISKPRKSEFLWVRDFPLFTPTTSTTDPGHGGTAGLKSTHHPFTAPKHPLGYKALATVDPLELIGDHFDLVINGVEVGGGSRRIHDSNAQELVLRDILKVPAAQLEGFRPLLGALAAGCPPHAGIALGFDRLMAIIMQKDSVRDVIAFPKMGGGEDRLMGSPSVVGWEAWSEYHMVPEQAREE